MEITVKDLVKMVNDVIQGKVLTQEQLAKATEGCAKLYGAHKSEIPQLIREVETQITFQLEEGVRVK